MARLVSSRAFLISKILSMIYVVVVCSFTYLFAKVRKNLYSYTDFTQKTHVNVSGIQRYEKWGHVQNHFRRLPPRVSTFKKKVQRLFIAALTFRSLASKVGIGWS